MSDTFSSKALEVNLARTRDAEIEIPEDQQWFLDLVSFKMGEFITVQVNFITELNHKYVNYQYVIDSLHTISLTDLWFYNSLQESERAFAALVDIFAKLLDSDMDGKYREQLVKTLIRFVDRLANLEGFPKDVVGRCLTLIRDDLSGNEHIYMINSGYFKSYFNRIAQFPEYQDILFKMTSGLLEKSIQYLGKHLRSRRMAPGEKPFISFFGSEKKCREIGKPFFEHLKSELEKAGNWDQLCELMFFNDISNYFAVSQRNLTLRWKRFITSISCCTCQV